MYADDEIQDKKKQFADALLRNPLDAYRAALEVDTRPNYATWIASTWQFDDDVQTHMKAIRAEEGVIASIPTKEEFAASIFRDAQETRHKDTRLDYYKLFAQIMGYIEKPANGGGANVSIDNRKVIVLPANSPSIEDWETMAVSQQRKLVDDAATG